MTSSIKFENTSLTFPSDFKAGSEIIGSLKFKVSETLKVNIEVVLSNTEHFERENFVRSVNKVPKLILQKYGNVEKPHMLDILSEIGDELVKIDQIELEDRKSKPLPEYKFNPKSRQCHNPWCWDDKDLLWLLTLDEFKLLPIGTDIEDICGQKIKTTSDWKDDETRYGYMAYGIKESKLIEINEKINYSNS
jgi:hypothetical protein